MDAGARVYRVNPNQIYDWRKQYRKGSLGGKPDFVPVQVKVRNCGAELSLEVTQ